MNTAAGALPCPSRVVIGRHEYACQREHHPTRQLHTWHEYARMLRGGGELRLRWDGEARSGAGARVSADGGGSDGMSEQTALEAVIDAAWIDKARVLQTGDIGGLYAAFLAALDTYRDEIRREADELAEALADVLREDEDRPDEDDDEWARTIRRADAALAAHRARKEIADARP